MMGEFKVVFRCDLESSDDLKPTWEPGCPLQFDAIQVSRDTETGEAFLQGKIRNVSAEKAQSFKAVVKVKYKDGNEESIEFAPLDADIAPRAFYTLKPAKLQQGDAIVANGKIEAVDTDKGSWQTTGQALPIPEPDSLGFSDKAVEERYRRVFSKCRGDRERLRLAAARGIKEEGNWWLCSCGQINVNRDKCLSCRVSKDLLTAEEVNDENALIMAADERAAEEARKTDEAKRKKAAAKAKAIKITKIVTPILVGIILAVLLVVNVVIPAVKYASADGLAASAETQDQFQEAYAAFVELGEFNGAQNRAVEVANEAMLKASDEGDVEKVKYWLEAVENIYVPFETMMEYVKAHRESDDALTLFYLNKLIEAGSEEAKEIYEELYAWSFEFALVSYRDYADNGQAWTESSSVKTGSLGSGESDSAGILIKPFGGAINSTVGLKLEIEEIDGKSQSNYTGEWHSSDTKYVTFWKKNADEVLVDESARSLYGSYKDMDKGFVYLTLGNNTYDDAWRVTITSNTGEQLFQGEIREG